MDNSQNPNYLNKDGDPSDFLSNFLVEDGGHTFKETGRTSLGAPGDRRVSTEPDEAEKYRNMGRGTFNDHLLSQKIYNKIALAKSSSTTDVIKVASLDSLLEGIRNNTNPENNAILEKSHEKQNKLHSIKIDLANNLALMRKRLWELKIDRSELASEITLMLDAIEYSDHMIDNYKPPKYKIENKKNEIIIPDDPLARDQMFGIEKEKKQNDNVFWDLSTALITGSAVYIGLSYLTEWLALTLGIPFIFLTVLLASVTILVIKYNTQVPEKINTNNPKEINKFYNLRPLLTSIPGQIANKIYADPTRAIIHFGLTVLMIVALTKSTIGITLLNNFILFSGIDYYLALYALVLAGSFTMITIHKVCDIIASPQTHENNKKEQFKPYNINPAARLWQAMDLFLDKFYLLGMQNPISMLVFTTVYILITLEMVMPFMSPNIHNIVYYFVTGISNPSVGLLFAGICAGWFMGLFILTVSDIFTREYKSGLMESIEYIKQNPIDSLIFMFILIFSANIAAQTSLAHVCGRWMILGLVTINFKPMLAVLDFIDSPRKSIIGSTFSLALLPVNLILYPGELLKYIFKKALHIVFGIVKHFGLHVPMVLIRAVFDIVSISLAYLNFKNAAKQVSSWNIDLYLFIRKLILNTKYVGKLTTRAITPFTDGLGQICYAFMAVIGCLASYTGLYYIWLGTAPHITSIPWISAPLKLLTTILGVKAATTILAVAGAFMVFTCTHQLLCKKFRGSVAEEQFTHALQFLAMSLGVISTIIYFTTALELYPAAITSIISFAFFAVTISSLSCYNNEQSTGCLVFEISVPILPSSIEKQQPGTLPGCEMTTQRKQGQRQEHFPPGNS
jgi:hypothetical protein